MASHSRDEFAGLRGLNTPADRWYQITPDDVEMLPDLPKALIVGHDHQGGPPKSDLVIEDRYGNQMTLSVVPGQVLALRPVKVLATGTTAGIILFACW